jgi:LysM repeat protein
VRTRWALATLLAAVAGFGLPQTVSAAMDPQVAGLQVALRSHGLYAGPIDGLTGPATTAAVRAFQKRTGLPATGGAGKRTRAALGRLGKPLFGMRVLARGMVGWDVAVLQFLLTRNRCPTRIIDGYFGDETVRALKCYQRAAGLLPDSVAGPATVKALTGGRLKAPSQPRPKPSEMTYVVEPGDSLTAIAARFGTTVAALARANDLDPARVLLIGTKLRVPAVTEPGSGTVRDLIDRWAAEYGVNRSLARALAWQESGFQTDLTSPAGAWGVMQVTPDAWAYVEDVLLGERVPRTTEGNIRVGLLYIRQLLGEFSGNEHLALGAWYQGAKAVRDRGLYGETKLFVANVLALKGRM